jgi:hypothetical protein
MRSFACGHCGRLVFFENSACLHCGTELGFDSEGLELIALEGLVAERRRRCANAELARCNWLVRQPGELCLSCSLTRTRPADADHPAWLERFATAEGAKRRAIMQLLSLAAPGLRPGELCFDLLSSGEAPVATGHADGVITIDLAESDDARREQRRLEMDEPYRTMLGHLRHELGHYFQPLIITGPDWELCRALFGDERQDYQQSLKRHHETGPPADWSNRFVSAYATMHPWEDWAETFAHYLHIQDTVETAAEYGVSVRGPRAVTFDRALKVTPQPEAGQRDFAELIDAWLPLTYALNAVNRSMGAGDLYPFALSPPAIEKLAFVHDRVLAAGSSETRERIAG